MVQSFFLLFLHIPIFSTVSPGGGGGGTIFRIFWNEDTSVTLFQVCFCMIVGAKKDRNIAQPVVSP